MPPLSRAFSWVPALLGTLGVACPTSARGEGLHVAEYVGLEAGPGWMNLASKPVVGNLPLLSWTPTGTLRLARLEIRSFYWTPIQFGLGFTSSDDLVVHLSTELGKRLTLGRSGFVDFGLGAGAGASLVEYWRMSCDGSCVAGGFGPMLSPVVRVGLASDAFSAALFVRFLLIVNTGTTADHAAYPLLFGVDVALRKRPINLAAGARSAPP